MSLSYIQLGYRLLAPNKLGDWYWTPFVWQLNYTIMWVLNAPTTFIPWGNGQTATEILMSCRWAVAEAAFLNIWIHHIQHDNSSLSFQDKRSLPPLQHQLNVESHKPIHLSQETKLEHHSSQLHPSPSSLHLGTFIRHLQGVAVIYKEPEWTASSAYAVVEFNLA